MLHLLNGDATASRFPATLPGDRVVWRDIMVEGPAVDDGATRAAWLAPRLGVSPAEYERGWREGQEMLSRAAADDDVVLWFEQDLFCAVNLWYVLARLPPSTPVSLVFPPLTESFAGLGTLTADAFGPLFEGRARLDEATRGDARALWRAYAAAEPIELPRLGSRFPFARRAVRLHLGRFPSTTHGVDELELAVLQELARGSRAFSTLFQAVTRSALLRPHGMGDIQFASALRDLEPLVAIENAAAPPAEWRVSLSATGADVLAERLDGLASRALDRWLGGVHIRPGSRVWRWDGGRILRE